MYFSGGRGQIATLLPPIYIANPRGQRGLSFLVELLTLALILESSPFLLLGEIFPPTLSAMLPEVANDGFTDIPMAPLVTRATFPSNLSFDRKERG